MESDTLPPFAVGTTATRSESTTNQNTPEAKSLSNEKECFIANKDNSNLIEQVQLLINSVKYDDVMGRDLEIPTMLQNLKSRLQLLKLLPNNITWDARKLRQISPHNDISVETELLRSSTNDKIKISSFEFIYPGASGNLDKKNSISSNSTQKSNKQKNQFLEPSPPIFGVYNSIKLFSRAGIEFLFEKLSHNSKTDDDMKVIISERQLKESLYIVIKFLEYFFMNTSISFEMWSTPIDFYFSRISDTPVLYNRVIGIHTLFNKIPKGLLCKSFDSNQEFFKLYCNLTESIIDSNKWTNFFEWIIELIDLHRKEYFMEFLPFLQDDNIPTTFSVAVPKYLQVEEILSILAIEFFQRSAQIITDNLVFLESLLKFIGGRTWIENIISIKNLVSFVVRYAINMGLYRWEYYIGMDEEIAERKRICWWQCCFWDLWISITQSLPSAIDYNMVTCLYPKNMIDLGIVDSTSLYSFLLREGHKLKLLSPKDLEKCSLIIYIQIMADFSGNILFNKKYSQLGNLLSSTHTKVLHDLLKDVDYYHRYLQILYFCVDMVQKAREKEEDSTEEKEKKSSPKLPDSYESSVFFVESIKMKQVFNLIRAYFFFSSNELINKLAPTPTDDIKEKIAKYNKEYLKSSYEVIKVSMNSDTFITLSKLIGLNLKAMVNILCFHLTETYFFNKDDLLLFFQVYKTYTASNIIKEFDNIQNADSKWKNRASVTINLFKFFVQILLRLICQCYQEQEKMSTEEFVDFIGEISDYREICSNVLNIKSPLYVKLINFKDFQKGKKLDDFNIKMENIYKNVMNKNQNIFGNSTGKPLHFGEPNIGTSKIQPVKPLMYQQTPTTTTVGPQPSIQGPPFITPSSMRDNNAQLNYPLPITSIQSVQSHNSNNTVVNSEGSLTPYNIPGVGNTMTNTNSNGDGNSINQDYNSMKNIFASTYNGSLFQPESLTKNVVEQPKGNKKIVLNDILNSSAQLTQQENQKTSFDKMGQFDTNFNNGPFKNIPNNGSYAEQAEKHNQQTAILETQSSNDNEPQVASQDQTLQQDTNGHKQSNFVPMETHSKSPDMASLDDFLNSTNAETLLNNIIDDLGSDFTLANPNF
ncbi:uncharacterized protein SCODWIG_01547 [Saccharomycodes ludwigii]|uniref:Xylanolytic transcriptional activator regulatory domain-containing protein n=1 Tax=Saccharomycodes ludwigii TaxID=36035 RepID=A0A376B516_9ASCO|nr:uncharacterized protein SCODWIG_01547 [Saccharomycodes ludwigii]